MFNTTSPSRGFAEIYKTIPNVIIGTGIKIAQPFEGESKLDELVECYYNSGSHHIKIISLDTKKAL